MFRQELLLIVQTEFALQTRQNHRQIYRQNSHDEEVDKVQPVNTMQLSTELRRNYRLNSPCKCNAVDNARQANSVMLNAAAIAQSENSQLSRD